MIAVNCRFQRYICLPIICLNDFEIESKIKLSLGYQPPVYENTLRVKYLPLAIHTEKRNDSALNEITTLLQTLVLFMTPIHKSKGISY